MGVNISDFLSNKSENLHKGYLAEQFVGQQLLAHAQFRRPQLFYWEREKRGSSAEIDFILDRNSSVVPIEVKSGKAGSLKSMRVFLETYPECQQGVRFSLHNVDQQEKLLSLPLYTVGLWKDS